MLVFNGSSQSVAYRKRVITLSIFRSMVRDEVTEHVSLDKLKSFNTVNTFSDLKLSEDIPRFLLSYDSGIAHSQETLEFALLFLNTQEYHPSLFDVIESVHPKTKNLDTLNSNSQILPIGWLEEHYTKDEMLKGNIVTLSASGNFTIKWLKENSKMISLPSYLKFSNHIEMEFAIGNMFPIDENEREMIVNSLSRNIEHDTIPIAIFKNSEDQIDWKTSKKFIASWSACAVRGKLPNEILEEIDALKEIIETDPSSLFLDIFASQMSPILLHKWIEIGLENEWIKSDEIIDIFHRSITNRTLSTEEDASLYAEGILLSANAFDLLYADNSGLSRKESALNSLINSGHERLFISERIEEEGIDSISLSLDDITKMVSMITFYHLDDKELDAYISLSRERNNALQSYCIDVIIAALGTQYIEKETVYTIVETVNNYNLDSTPFDKASDRIKMFENLAMNPFLDENMLEIRYDSFCEKAEPIMHDLAFESLSIRDCYQPNVNKKLSFRYEEKIILTDYVNLINLNDRITEKEMRDIDDDKVDFSIMF
ncbi:MAG: hypothetical protein HOG49_04030 [Candidatus Scalindua sp.]|jgi:hypothetical protein|nr:hypothetical protein [Candidatus Scalindua sp.]